MFLNNIANAYYSKGYFWPLNMSCKLVWMIMEQSNVVSYYLFTIAVHSLRNGCFCFGLIQSLILAAIQTTGVKGNVFSVLYNSVPPGLHT